MQMALMENTVQDTLHVPGTVPNQHIPGDTNNRCNSKGELCLNIYNHSIEIKGAKQYTQKI